MLSVRLYMATRFGHNRRAPPSGNFRMARDSALNVSVGVIAAILASAAAYEASEVFAPLALALFIIAIVWPLQCWLQARMPALLALAITMTLTVAACLAFASLVVWGFGRVGLSL